MNTTKILADWGQTAMAAYAAGLDPARDNRDAYIAPTVGMASMQAQSFNATWAVIVRTMGSGLASCHSNPRANDLGSHPPRSDLGC